MNPLSEVSDTKSAQLQGANTGTLVSKITPIPSSIKPQPLDPDQSANDLRLKKIELAIINDRAKYPQSMAETLQLLIQKGKDFFSASQIEAFSQANINFYADSDDLMNHQRAKELAIETLNKLSPTVFSAFRVKCLEEKRLSAIFELASLHQDVDCAHARSNDSHLSIFSWKLITEDHTAIDKIINLLKTIATEPLRSQSFKEIYLKVADCPDHWNPLLEEIKDPTTREMTKKYLHKPPG